jgi:hypothetical protein
LNNIKSKSTIEYEESGFHLEEIDDGDESMDVKPWMNNIKPPSTIPAYNDNAPDVDVTLDYCYGYRVAYDISDLVTRETTCTI